MTKRKRTAWWWKRDSLWWIVFLVIMTVMASYLAVIGVGIFEAVDGIREELR